MKITKALDFTLGGFFNLVDPRNADDTNTLVELIDILKSRNFKEQEKLLFIIKNLTEMIDAK